LLDRRTISHADRIHGGHLTEAQIEPSANQHRWGESASLRKILPWFIIVLFAGLGYRSMLPPAPLPSNTPADQFSAERAMEHVAAIAAEPHPIGSAAIAAVRDYIVAELETLGIDVELQTINAPNYFGGGELVSVVNIIARIPGFASSKAIALMAHYDTVPATPGGNDNTAAVAALLETGRALLAGPPQRNDVILLFTDGEEPAPRFGATAFVSDHPAVRDIGLVVNLEAIGHSGASLLVETSGSEGWLIREFAAADSNPAAFSFLTEIARLLGDIGTDFDTFRNAGVTGMHFVYLHGSPVYHTAADNIDAVNWGSLQHHGSHTLGIARHFGTLDLSNPPRPADAVFFTIRPFFFRYAAGWALPLAFLTVACLWLVAGRRSTGSATPSLLRALGLNTVVGVLAAIVGTIVWLAIVAVRSTPGVAESYLYLSGLLALAALIAARFQRKNSHQVYDLGIIAAWVSLGMLTSFAMPGFSYIFVWPALAACVGLLWDPGDSATQRNLRFGLVAAPTLLLATPAIDVFFLLAQPHPGDADSQLSSVVAIALLLGLLVIGLLRTAWPGYGSAPESATWARERRRE
jgi:hypothetical protein